MKTQHRILFFFMFLLLLAFVKYWKLAGMAFDVSMYMVVARHILGGARPYVDVVDINPPLVIYIHVFIVWFANLFKVAPLELYDRALLIANFGIAFFITRKLRAFAEVSYYAAIGFLMVSLHALIAFQYGQREQLFMTFLIPYFCLRWDEKALESVSLYILTLMTGLLACLKPGFFAILASYEVVLYIYRKKLAMRQWFLLCIPGLVYLAHFMFLPQDISDGFWIDLVPIVWSRYWTMGLSMSEMAEFWGLALLCYGSLASLSIFMGLNSEDYKFKILVPIGICSLVGMVSAVSQGKGWEYHLMPVQYFLFFGFPILLLALHQHITTNLKMTAVGVLLFIVLGQHSYHFFGDVSITLSRFTEVCGNEELKSIAPRGSRIAIMAVHPCFSYPLFYEQNYSLGTRYMVLFPLAFFNYTPERLEMLKTHYPNESDLSSEEKKFVNNVKIDLMKNKPDFIIFPTQLVPEEFDSYRYSMSTGIFPDLVKSYKLVPTSLPWRVYRRI
jgi:hypothetical protein